MKANPLAVKYILIATFYFALMNVCIKILPDIPPYELAFFRSSVVITICYVILKKQKINPFGNDYFYLSLRGIFGAIGLLMYFYTLQTIPLATAVTLQYLSPIFSAIIAIFILKEKTRARNWVFFLISFSGVLLIKQFDSQVSYFNLMIGIASAFTSGLAYNFIRKVKDTEHPMVVVFYLPLMTLPLVTPYTIMNWVMPKPQDFIFLFLLGVFTQQSQYYMTKAYQNEKMGIISNFNYIGIIYAIILGYLIFDEKVSFMSFVGMGIIALSLILSSKQKV